MPCCRPCAPLLKVCSSELLLLRVSCSWLGKQASRLRPTGELVKVKSLGGLVFVLTSKRPSPVPAGGLMSEGGHVTAGLTVGELTCFDLRRSECEVGRTTADVHLQ